ncbi:murein biosynthesis integral membrane protein MurJ [Marisediminicola senii]|uniref:murein biosynthesis integral membrane protein MurJ n=1 Tax=Marisediminicola senii TaxID=2711233 RepID=UPI0013EB3596|nr:murein biosynthesis integral membrane protein MurJ [Marisediminicola senii]
MTDAPRDPVPDPTPSGLGRASALLASGTLVSRILGFVKAIVLAATIGQVGSAAGNAFAVGNQLPNNIYALIAGGVLGAILVPQIVRAGLHDDGGQRFINKIVTLGATVFIVIAILATLAAPLLVALYAQSSADGERGFTPEGIALATAFAYWCLPQVLFYALYSLLGEVLNARKAFGPFTWAPVLNNVVAIAGLVAFSILFGGAAENSDVAVWDTDRIAVLAGTTTLGVAAQAAVLVLFWRRAGLSFRPDFRWRGVGLRRTGRSAGWVFGMILVTQVAGIFQSNVASIAADNGPGLFALSNSWLIFMLPHSVIAVSIATAYFTRMSGHATTGNMDGVRDDVSASLRSIGLLVMLAAAALLVAAIPFAAVFETDYDNAVAMAWVIMAFLVGLVPFSAVFVMQRVFYSLEDTRTPFFVETVKAGLFIIGALIVSTLPTDRIGVGIAAVTTLAGLAQAVLTFVLLRRRLGHMGGRLILRRHVQYVVASLPAAAVGVGVLLLLGGLDPTGFAHANRYAAILTVAVIGAVMAGVYFAVLLVMRVPELDGVVQIVSRRIRRRR